MSEISSSALPKSNSGASWELAVETFGDIVYQLTVDGEIIDGNPSFYAMLKRSPHEVKGNLITDWVIRDDQALCERVLHSIRKSRRPERTTRSFKPSSGAVCTHEVVETPIIQDGEITAISGVGRDITQEVVLEQKLWDTEEDRRSTLEFALRTSMGLVKGYVYTLESGDTLAPEQRKRYSSVVLEEIDNLSKIVDDLLDLHHLEENSLSFGHQVTDLGECVELALNQFRSEIARRDIELRCNIPEDLDPIHLPPDALIRILTNLIQNSILHTLHSGRIVITVVDSDDYVDISIVDNGTGISEQDLPHIFEKYYRGGSSTAAAEQGAGLGLVVTRILVDALGGKIWVTSKPGEETEFRFVLPRKIGGFPDMKKEASMCVSSNPEIKASEVAK